MKPELCHRCLASICFPQYFMKATLRLSGGSSLLYVRLFPSSPHGPAERGEVIRSHLTLTVDEEGGGARYTAHVGALDVRCDPFGPSVVSKVIGERLHIETELIGVADQVLGDGSSWCSSSRSCIAQKAPCAAAASDASAAI